MDELYQKINWGWLNDYNGYKFAPITFVDQLYNTEGNSFLEEYNKHKTDINNIINNGVVNSAYYLTDENTNKKLRTTENVPVYFLNGVPTPSSEIIIDKITFGAAPMKVKIGRSTKDIGYLKSEDVYKWSSNEIGFFSLADPARKIDKSNNENGDGPIDLDNYISPNAYHCLDPEICKEIKNLPEGLGNNVFRLLIMTMYGAAEDEETKEMKPVPQGTRQIIFTQDEIYTRCCVSSGITPPIVGTEVALTSEEEELISASENKVLGVWTAWKTFSYLEDALPWIQNGVYLTGPVQGKVDFQTGQIATTLHTENNILSSSQLQVIHNIPRNTAEHNWGDGNTSDFKSDRYIMFMDSTKEAKNAFGRIRSNFILLNNDNIENVSNMEMVSYATSNEKNADGEYEINNAGLYVYTTPTGISEAGVFGNTKPVFMGAAWNDYAEFRKQREDIEPGYCVASDNSGQVYKTTEKFQPCDGIVSDTYGFAIGKTEECRTPLAVSGRVLVYFNGNKEDYNSGDTVCAGPNGRVCKMSREEIKEYPDRIIGIVSEIPDYEEWNGKQVNNRIWVKVR